MISEKPARLCYTSFIAKFYADLAQLVEQLIRNE